MKLTRRQLIQQLAVAGLAGAGGGFSALARAAAPRIIPWRNWSGGQSCIPLARLAPKSEDELAQIIRNAPSAVRPVGSSHSFSGLVPTDGTLVSLAHLHGMLGHDASKLQSDWAAGTPMTQMGAPLKAAGLALPNMADIDYQTLAGAISTATHGTGINFGSYSGQVIGLRLVTAKGEVLDCDAEKNPEIFRAAQVSLGALGVISRVRLQNRKAFRLREKMWIAKTEELLEQVPQLTRDNQHWEMQVITHSEYAAAIALNETTDALTPPLDPAEEGGNAYVKAIEKLDKYGSDWPAARSAILNLIAKTASFEDRVGDSYEIFANVRNVRFNEMEYSVPAEHGPACLREILKLIHDKQLPTWFPIEYRYVHEEAIPLSMFEGGPRCAISIHQYYTMDHHNYFAAVEPIFWKYGGRPHWGKLHNLGARQLSTLYPRWKEFTEVRAALDPQGKFLNGHLRTLFGV
ncbi:FAD-binding protein [Stagnimonas aquatica]|uniref:FAD-binding protein n=1 Tax=Stagnimonas aquatica TaxID=2689987 RepID=A0A3N0V2T7_9GAMM|nr:D-arabinono-1,4-lactone oxidase [Stagnimonas aquatica]ROH86778.1 FAD-binding protein [Stagnimonas aquatica]